MEFMYTHRGASYLDVLSRFHSFLNPETYLEIGTLNGETLKLSSCATICVDPFFQIAGELAGQRSATMLFQITSDRFFQKYVPRKLLGGPVELAFLDGLHEAETLLRDFSNLEKSCRANSIICIHDCLPMNVEMTRRDNDGGLWTGDVWKIIPILKQYRPDLRIFSLDAGPTGLVCCTNLDPTSRVIDDNYGNIWDEWRKIGLQDYGFDKLIETASIIWTEDLASPENMRRYFWL